MNINNLHNVYFIGIGGIGMSALARFFMDHGKLVSGYDKTPSDITKALERDGVYIHYKDELDLIPTEVVGDPGTLIIYTPAIPGDHKGLNHFMNNAYKVKKRSQVLGDITKNKFTIAVGGTHGKTSTSSMITHLLTQHGIDCYALIGGIMVNYNSNYISPQNKNADIFVVEADEYDRSFLQLSPDIAIINSTDPDHLDIYHNPENLNDTYGAFAKCLKEKGILSTLHNIDMAPPPQVSTKYSFGFEERADFRAYNLQAEKGSYYFDVKTPFGEASQLQLNIAGDHNVLNLLAALSAACHITKLSPDSFRKAIASYQGVKRRFEYILKNEKNIFIDDYAHHPTELNTTITSVKKLFPDKKLCGIFQPHLYSRTRDFADGFAKSMSQLDEIILLEIYPARELPIEGVSSQMILDKINHPNKKLLSKEALLDYIKTSKPELLLTLGAGDIDRLVEPLKAILS